MQQVQTNGGRELTGQEAATNGTQPHRQTVSSGSPVRIKREPDDVASGRALKDPSSPVWLISWRTRVLPC